MLPVLDLSWFETQVPGMGSIGQGLRELLKKKFLIFRVSTQRIEKTNDILLSVSFAIVELLEPRDFVFDWELFLSHFIRVWWL